MIRILIIFSVTFLISCSSVTIDVKYDNGEGTKINIQGSKIKPESELINKLLGLISKEGE